MTSKITLEESLELVEFWQDFDGTWYVKTVKGDCCIVKGNCGIVKGNCSIVEGNCSLIKGNCRTVEGEVLNTINGREGQYIETQENN